MDDTIDLRDDAEEKLPVIEQRLEQMFGMAGNVPIEHIKAYTQEFENGLWMYSYALTIQHTLRLKPQ
jgi:hypothetical protein